MPMATEFAAAERSPREAVLAQMELLERQPLFRDVVNRVPDMVLVLNSARQIVYANRAALVATQAEGMASIAGLRPGELFHCKHSSESDGGCGTTRFCRYCGAANAILHSQAGVFNVEECRLVIVRDGVEEALDLRAWASPMRVADEQFTFFVVADIGDEKRRLWLEKIFLHDLMNTATALRGFSALLNSKDEEPQPDTESMHNIAALAERMVGEIEAHRLLVAAENNELKPQFSSVDTREIIEEAVAAYNHPEALNRRELRIDGGAKGVALRTDRTLLLRVIGNMVKNGLESSVPGETVTVGCHGENGSVVFWVHNSTYMPENVRLQVFNRSFSTKGSGRGLGTYSMKLLSERYLHGKVSFTSSELEGTVFAAKYPAGL